MGRWWVVFGFGEVRLLVGMEGVDSLHSIGEIAADLLFIDVKA